MTVGILSVAEASLYVGMAMLMLAIVWGFLFLHPKSPVKKYWWSIPDKLMFTMPQELGYQATVNNEIITAWVDLTSPSGIMVDRIVLKIERKEGIPSFEWNPQTITTKHAFLDFHRPNWLTVGKYEARLIAYTPQGHSSSGRFTLEVDSKLGKVENGHVGR